MKVLTSFKTTITYSSIAFCWLFCIADCRAQAAPTSNAARAIQGAANTLDTTQRARLTLHLTGGGTAARWGYTNPDTGIYLSFASDDTATIKADYFYYISFNTPSGWQIPQPLRGFADANETKTYTVAYTPRPSGFLSVNLTGDNGLGQWQLYMNGNPNPIGHNSGDSVRLNTGWYYIEFKNVPNYNTPQYQSVTISDNTTNSLTATYQEIVYHAVQINLTGANGTGRWTQDSDTTQHRSGDTLHLANNTVSTISPTSVQGWESPLGIDIYGVSLRADTANTQTLIYTKIKKGIARIHISSGGANAQWSADGGLTWRNSDDTLHTFATNTLIVFKNIPRWTSPNDLNINANDLDTININAFTADYTPIPYRAVQVGITGANGLGQWTIDADGILNANPIWRNSNDTAQVDTRFGYSIIYKNISNFVKPSGEWIYLNSPVTALYYTEGEYTPIQYGIAKITLTGANGQGRWRIRGNNTGIYYTAWRNSNDTVRLRSDVTDYRVQFQNVVGWAAPSLAPIGVGANHTTTFPFHYTIDSTSINPLSAKITVHLTGDNGLGLWAIDGIEYHSDDTITVMLNTCPIIVYTDVNGLITPYSSMVCANAGVNTVVGTYRLPQRNYLTVNLTGDSGQGAWTPDWGNAWHQSGDTITTFAGQQVNIRFKDVLNRHKPDQVQTYLQGGTSLSFAYTPLRYARVVLHIGGANAHGRYTIDNDPTQYAPNDTIVLPYYSNSFYVNFQPVTAWYAPNPIYIMPDIDSVNVYNATYTPLIYTSLSVHITGAAGQGRWTADGRTLHRSDDTVQVEANAYLDIQYADVPNWVTPSYMQTYTDTTLVTMQGIYTAQPIGSICVFLTGANGQGQWSIDNGSTWHNGGDRLHVPANNTYTIITRNIAGWNNQTNSSTYLNPNENYSATLTYSIPVYKTLTVTLTGGNGQGQWRVYDYNTATYSAWRNSNDTLNLLRNTAYALFFKNISHYNRPANDGANVQIGNDSIYYLTSTYTPMTYAVLKVVLTGDSGLGQWRANSGALHQSNDTVMVAAGRSVYIAYTAVSGLVIPTYFYIQSISTTNLNTVFAEYLPTYITFTGNILGGGGSAQWTLDGGNTWHNHADTLHLSTNQSYTIQYKNVVGWATPVNYSFAPTQNLTYAATYIVQQFGIIKVNIAGGNSCGRWRIGNSIWHISGDTLHLPTGSIHLLDFKNVPRWISPGQYEYTPSANQILNLPAQYVETPITILKTTLTGGDDEGLWSIGDGRWYNNADTLHLSALQQYTLLYRDVSGWITPNTISPFEPNGSITQVITATYTRPFSLTSVLTVNLYGTDGLAQWTVNNGTTWHNSGDTLHLQPQTYSVNYKNISGYITPLFSRFRGQDGDSTINISYQAIQYNTLKVNLIGSGGLAQWTIDGTTWHNSGDTLHLPSYLNYYINYKTVAGWISPLYNAYPATTTPSTTITATYQAIGYGILQVNLTGGSGLAQWTIDGTRWLNSTDTLRLPNTRAFYYVSYKTIAGWIKPQGASYSISANQTTLVNAEYSQIGYGILQVNLAGSNGQGRWTIDNGATWRNSGDTISLINRTVLYTIKYSSVIGWLTPINLNFQPTVCQTTIINGIYVLPFITNPTAIKVIITGASGQGLWSTNELDWRTSGDSILYQNSSSPAHIYFAPVNGWAKPQTQTITLATNQTLTTVGNYLRIVSTTNPIEENDLIIYPNPTDDILYCTIKNQNLNNISRLHLYNAIGVLVYESSLSANDTHRISTTALSSGFYVLYIYDEQTHTRQKQKIIVRH